MKRLLLTLALCASVLVPALAHAWWNQDWTARRKISIDPATLGLQGPVNNAPVLVRLHTGNFPFVEADLDGKDLRFIAEDDKTPLAFHVELFDSANELALVWVQLPQVAPGAKPSIWMYYGNDNAPSASNAAATYDPSHLAVFHFAEKAGTPVDSTAYAQPATVEGVAPAAAGVSDGAISVQGAGRVVLADSPSLKASAQGFSISAWIKPAEGASGTLFESADGNIAAKFDAGQAWIVSPAAASSKAPLAPGTWHHVALVIGTEALLYVDGREVAKLPAPAGFTGGWVAGAGFSGDIDELQAASEARSADWVRLASGSQGEGSAFLQVSSEAESGSGEEGASYLRILLGAVTLDGWIVIAILMVMMVISFWVMAAKGFVLARIESANKAFQNSFASVGSDILSLQMSEREARHASLGRLYAAAAAELHKRVDGQGDRTVLSAQSIDAIRATLDAGVIRENAKLNSQMVLLTIAISGGPFLGLLGTVVGVMITFAAIAAAGDVNVNSIAPGIAAALVATVAGLAVAIPALFGYNYLAAQVKNISADMAVFVDEIVSRIAEKYAP
jgi:biopolymer transport protein ExbB